ncbi:ABC transporter permease [Zavarzinella formosa]|uniref:ABC transporter permease n=1 Tax=Zavarzinella formosa TaxID=360055 RepID=UPI00030E26AB|nr:ABC transporter permease [Zavarzinella formosa]
MYFVTFVLKNLTRRPVRTALTVIGLAVSVGSMIALLGISENVEHSITDSLARRGVDLVVTSAGKTDQLASEIDEKLIDQVRQIPGVKEVSPAMVELIEITRDSGTSINVLVQGWPADNFVYEDIKILSGRRLLAGDHGKAMLGLTLSESMGKGVGDKVTIQGEPFEVVGVYQSFVVFENGSAALPLDEVQRMMARPGKVTGFSMRVEKSHNDPNSSVEAIRQQVNALTDSTGKPAKLSAQTTQSYVDSVSQLKVVRAMAWMVSVIGMLIGVISMLNTMVMSVLERTQEIGILRAIGWPRRRVVKMILGESVILALSAAVLGTIGAFAATYVLALFPKVNGFIEGGVPLKVAMEGTAFAVLIGLFGGSYPAFRAARLLPTEAIRHV